MSESVSQRRQYTIMLIVLCAAVVGVAWLRFTHPVQRVVGESGSLQTVGPKPPELPDMRLDLNSAPAAELAALPGIGPRLAARIVASRENDGRFVSVDDLQRVKWIGPAIVDDIRPYVVVE